jgi:hypothetical protein
MELSPQRQILQIQSCRSDVLTEVARPYGVALLAKLSKQFHWNEMHLTQIAQSRPSSREETMSSILTSMRIAFHPVTFDQSDLLFNTLAKAVLRI